MSEEDTCLKCGGIGTIEDPFLLITETCEVCHRNLQAKPIHIDEELGTVVLGWPDLSSL